MLLDADHARDDFAGLLDDHGVTDTDPQSLQFVPVVQARPRHRCSGDLNGIHFCHRCQRSGLTDLNGDFPDRCGAGVAFPLVGDHPAGALAGCSQPLALFEVVEFQYQSIDLKIQRVHVVHQGLSVLTGRNDVGTGFDTRSGGQSHPRDRIEELGMRSVLPTLDVSG